MDLLYEKLNFVYKFLSINMLCVVLYKGVYSKQKWRDKMTSETYVECLVAKKPSVIINFLKILCIMLAVAFFLLGFITNWGWIALIAAVLFAILAYVAYLKCDVEFEYLYLDREISIDRISAKSKRKRIATYEIDRMEIFAPMNSYHLDNYRNRQTTVKDYSSGVESQPEKRYVMYYEGNLKVIFEPSAEFVKAMANVAPRKVFKD